MNAHGRLPAMDNLRALAMLAGVGFHAALAYSPMMHALWPAADAGNAPVVDALAWFLHAFRMPVFFLVAGYFSAHLVARRGLAGLFRNRGARVGLPLLVFLPLASLAMHALMLQAAEASANPPPALDWIRGHLQAGGELSWLTGWMHLWFLFYLLVFTLLAWVVATLGFERVGERLARLPTAALVLLPPLALAPALIVPGAPWPAPDGFLPALWAMAYFGAYFALGAGVFRNTGLVERLRPAAWYLLAGAVAAHALLFWWRGGAPAHGWPVLLEAATGYWMTLWCLLAATRWLDTSQPLLRWLADASYWVYLVHLPVLFALQYRLMDVAMQWPAKWALATGATLVLCLASYQWLVRGTVVGRLLAGRLFKARLAPTPERAA